MERQQVRRILQDRTRQDGLTDTGVRGVKLFRATASVPCAPAVYEPCVIAIASGAKEAVLDGERYVYDERQYLCCPMSMPVLAGTPAASSEKPLLGVLISLDQRQMTELCLEMDHARDTIRPASDVPLARGIRLAHWDQAFSDALLRLLQLEQSQRDTAILGEARLRELYYAILNGEAGPFARQAFGVGNAIARTIAQISSDLRAPISIDDMAMRAGMSRAVFHRKFKRSTAMSPIQFVKMMRLNNAAMKMAEGMTVSEAAIDVGYLSPSQFSREFKRIYGQSPRRWSKDRRLPAETA